MKKPEPLGPEDGFHTKRQGACADFILENSEAVYRFLFHLTRNVHCAEDLTQETFGAAWERIATFEGRSSMGTWIHRIAYTKFIDRHRVLKREELMRENQTLPTQFQTDPLAALALADESKCLFQALGGLDNPHRTMIVLHYLQGLSYREMAEVVGEPTGTVKWRTSEALTQLRKLLTKKENDHERKQASQS